MTQQTYTTTDLLCKEQEQQGFPLIWELAVEVLRPRETWKHLMVTRGEIRHCLLCGTIAPEAENGGQCTWRPTIRGANGYPLAMPELAERLVKKAMPYRVLRAIAIQNRIQPGKAELDANVCAPLYSWFIFDATPAERCVCALMALLPERIKVQ